MSVVVTTVAPMTADMYDAVTAKVMTGDQLPEGCQLHIAGPIDEGWRVITVWDTPEAFNQFRDQRLLPAIREVSGQEPPTGVVPQVNEVYRLITA